MEGDATTHTRDTCTRYTNCTPGASGTGRGRSVLDGPFCEAETRFVLELDDEPASWLAFTVVDRQDFDDDAGSGISWPVPLASLLLVTSCHCRDVLRRRTSISFFFTDFESARS